MKTNLDVPFLDKFEMGRAIVEGKYDDQQIYCEYCEGWSPPDLDRTCCARCSSHSSEAAALAVGLREARRHAFAQQAKE